MQNENHDIAITMSSSRADPILWLYILQGWLEEFKSMPQPWLEVFKCLIQSYYAGWGYLNIYISITALAGGKPYDEVLGAAQFTERTMHQCQKLL